MASNDKTEEEQVVAYTVWKCKLCGYLSDRDSIGTHLQRVHSIKCVNLFKDVATSYNIIEPITSQPIKECYEFCSPNQPLNEAPFAKTQGKQGKPFNDVPGKPEILLDKEIAKSMKSDLIYQKEALEDFRCIAQAQRDRDVAYYTAQLAQKDEEFIHKVDEYSNSINQWEIERKNLKEQLAQQRAEIAREILAILFDHLYEVPMQSNGNRYIYCFDEKDKKDLETRFQQKG